MFEHLKKYKTIYVTGPQRSGTTICSTMIAMDTGHQLIDEHDYGFSNASQFSLFCKKENSVIQCPIYCRYINKFSSDENLIIMMKRPIEEIIKSQKRIGWKHEQDELQRYNLTEGVISQVKYDYWEKQKKKIIHYLEVDYHSLKEHPLWVEERKHFALKQVK